MKIFIAADHTGVEFKDKLAQALKLAGHEVLDQGSFGLDPNDSYVELADKVAIELIAVMATDPTARGILISGSGQGMCMAANRHKSIRASLCWNVAAARSARSDHNSNVLCLSASYLSLEEAGSIMATWLSTSYEPTENADRRLQQLDQSGS